MKPGTNPEIEIGIEMLDLTGNNPEPEQGVSSKVEPKEAKNSRLVQVFVNIKEVLKNTAKYALSTISNSLSNFRNLFKRKPKNDESFSNYIEDVNPKELENNQPGFVRRQLQKLNSAIRKATSTTAKYVRAFFANRHVRIALASMVITALIIPFTGAIAGFAAAVGRSTIAAAATLIARAPSLLSTVGEFIAKNFIARSVAVFTGVFASIEVADKLKLKEYLPTVKKSGCCPKNEAGINVGVINLDHTKEVLAEDEKLTAESPRLKA